MMMIIILQYLFHGTSCGKGDTICEKDSENIVKCSTITTKLVLV